MTSADLKAPALLTHVEVARILGSDRTRQRWEGEGLLPSPRWVRGFGRSLGLYPGVVLARLAAGRNAEDLEAAVRDVVTRSGWLLGSSLFDEAIARLAPVIARLRPLGLTTDLLAMLSDRDVLGRLLEANAEIVRAEAGAGIEFHSRIGRCVRDLGESVVIEDRGNQVTFGNASVLGPIAVGESVAVESVRLGSRQFDYVMPALAVMTGSPAVADASEPDDADWELAFAGLGNRRPIAVPPAAIVDPGHEGGDIRRVRNQFAIRIALEIYEDANPMARA
jgi:hypothetical protein